MNSLLTSKKIMIIGVILLGIILLIITILSLNQQQKNNLPQPTKLPTYSFDNLQKDFDRINSPKPLTNSDQVVRQKLLKQLNNQSGTLFKNNDYVISYVASADQFMVEINSLNTDQAKKDSEQWFLQKGLSQSGICSLPAVYYLGGATLATFREQGKQFNPIPEGCQ